MAATIIPFGFGQAISSFRTAWLTAVAGDTLVGYGPWTESGPLIGLYNINKANITLEFTGGTYTFSSQHNLNYLFQVTAANFVLRGNGNLVISAYLSPTGSIYLSPAATGTKIYSARITDFGAAATTVGIRLDASNVTIYGCTIDTNVDAVNATVICIQVYTTTTITGLTCVGNTIHTIRATGATGTAYGVVARWGNVFLCENTVRDIRAGGGVYAFDLAAPGVATAGQTSYAVANKAFNLAATGATSYAYSFRVLQGTWKFASNLAYNYTSGNVTRTYGVSWGPTVVDPLDPVGYIGNCTMSGGFRGYAMVGGALLTVVLRNNCAVSATGGFAIGSGTLDSDYNQANGNATNYGVGWPVGPNDKTEAPSFVNPGAGDFHLQATSLYRNSGSPQSYGDFDLDGYHRNWQGSSWDIGAYEYLRPAAVVAAGARILPGATADFVHTVSGVVTPALLTTSIADFISTYALATGISGSITAGSTIFSDATVRLSRAAILTPTGAGRCFYVYSAAADENIGFFATTRWDSRSSFDTSHTFVADAASGSIRWALLPSWAANVLRHFGDLSSVESKLLVVDPPVGLAAGNYYIRINNLPPGGSLTFKKDFVVIP